MPRCCIGLGGNVGDVAATFGSALDRLESDAVHVTVVSRLYRTAPIGPEAGDAFHNACAIAETTLSPHVLLQTLQGLENSAGRTREVRWGERTLDLDLLTFDDLVLDETDLTIPHPGVVYRRFVLDPLAEIAPEFVHPVAGRSIADLRQRLLKRPLPLRLEFESDAVKLRIRAALNEKWGAAIELEPDTHVQLSDSTILTMNDPFRSALLKAQSVASMVVASHLRGIPSPKPPVHAELDARLASGDPVAAAVAVVTAMLDEPQIVGSLET